MELSRMLTSQIIANELEFSTSRSSGPGGQNVNKVNTKVTLRWNVRESLAIAPDEKELLIKKLGTRLTSDDVLLIVAQDKRSQLQNKEEVIRKLDQLLKKAFERKKKRKATKPSKSAVQKRLNQKKINSEKKKGRQSID